MPGKEGMETRRTKRNMQWQGCIDRGNRELFHEGGRTLQHSYLHGSCCEAHTNTSAAVYLEHNPHY